MNEVVPHVSEASSAPSHCLVYPQLDHNHAKGYFLLARGEIPSAFGGEGMIRDSYLSVEATQAICRDHAGLLGIAPREELTAALTEAEALRVENERLKEDLKEYDRRFEAIDILESAGHRARKKAGRPAKVA